jgi:2-polyprenyl-3-methyl-5-hydroxy-6-metoxy-1,4-benzoquinol methylase
MNNFTEIFECRCCGSPVETILDLNNQPLANSYHKVDEKLDFFPLKLNLCVNCFHLQLSIVVNPDIMFKNYLYVSGTTKTLKDYFDFFSRFTIERFKNYFDSKPTNVLDIACNDGTQLDYYKNLGLDTYGVDPAENLHHLSSENHSVVCDYFPSKQISQKFDLITAQNVFAHTHEIKIFLKECKNLLNDNGILFIQTSQSKMVLRNEFDTAYHEHLSFFNTKSMKTIVEKCGLKLNNVFNFDIHGSSYIFEISKKTYDSNVESVLEIESSKGLFDKKTYINFSKMAKEVTSNLKITLENYKNDGYKIIGYGAAAKGMTLLNFGKITMDLIIDDNSLKHGLYTPGTDIKIVDIEILKTFKDDKIVFVPLAWNFYDEIRKRIESVRKNDQDLFIKYFPKIIVTK